MNELEEYKAQDVFNPKYLFHGTAHEVEKLELRQSTDSENKGNEDNAVFLTSSFYTAAAYAFSRRLKKINEHYSFSMNNNGELPAMINGLNNIKPNLKERLNNKFNEIDISVNRESQNAGQLNNLQNDLNAIDTGNNNGLAPIRESEKGEDANSLNN